MPRLDEHKIGVKKPFVEWLKRPKEKFFTLKEKLCELGFKYKIDDPSLIVYEWKSKNIHIAIDSVQYIIGIYYKKKLHKHWTLFSLDEKKVFGEIKKAIKNLQP